MKHIKHFLILLLFAGPIGFAQTPTQTGAWDSSTVTNISDTAANEQSPEAKMYLPYLSLNGAHLKPFVSQYGKPSAIQRVGVWTSGPYILQITTSKEFELSSDGVTFYDKISNVSGYFYMRLKANTHTGLYNGILRGELFSGGSTTPQRKDSLAIQAVMTKANLILKAEDKNMLSGNVLPPLTMKGIGFVNGDGLEVLDQLPSISTSVSGNIAEGEYPITLSGGVDNDYIISHQTGTLVVTAQPMTQPKLFLPPMVTISSVYGEAAQQSYLVTALDISHPLTITPPAQYLEVSLDGVNYSSFVTLIPDGNHQIVEQSVFLRLKTDIPVGLYTLEVEHNTLLNHVSGSVKISITKRSITLVADNQIKKYWTTDWNPNAFHGEGMANGESAVAELDEKPLPRSNGNIVSAPVGTYTITMSQIAFDNNYLISQQVEGQLTVEPDTSPEFYDRIPKFQFTNIQDTIYTNQFDITKPMYAFTFSGQNLVTSNFGSYFSAGVTIVSKTNACIGAGKDSISANYFGTNTWLVHHNFLSASVNVAPTKIYISANSTICTGIGVYKCSFSYYGLSAVPAPVITITIISTPVKGPVTYTVKNLSKSYGSPNPSLGYTTTYYIPGITPVLHCNATQYSPPGIYPITMTLPALDTNLYSPVTIVAGQLTITKAQLAYQIYSASKAYGGPNPVLQYYTSNTIPGLDLILSCNATQFSPPGSYPITYSLPNIDTNLFLAPIVQTSSLYINKKVLTVQLQNAIRKVGEANPIFTWVITGFLPGDSVNDLDVLPKMECNAGALTPPGQYTILSYGGMDDFYRFEYIYGRLTIIPGVQKIPITFTVKNSSRAYGEANPSFTYSSSLNIPGLHPVFSCSAGENSPPGIYSINMTIPDLDTSVYQPSYVAGNLTLTKVRPVFTTISVARSYGDPNPTFTYTSLYKTPNLSPVFTCLADPSSKIGVYFIDIALPTLDTNLFLPPILYPGYLNITRPVLTIKALDIIRKEGEANPTFNFQIEGFKLGDGPAVLNALPLISCAADENAAPGEYPIVVDGGSDDLYIYTFIQGKLTVESLLANSLSAIPTPDKNALTIYPMPVRDRLTVRSSLEVNGLELVDMHGKICAQGNNESLITSNLSPGIYVLHIYTSEGSMHKQIVIE